MKSNEAAVVPPPAAVRKPTDPPPLGFLTFIGLVDDYDVIIEVRFIRLCLTNKPSHFRTLTFSWENDHLPRQAQARDKLSG